MRFPDDREAAQEWANHPYARKVTRLLDSEAKKLLEQLLSAARTSTDAKVAALGREYQGCAELRDFLKEHQ